MKERTELAIDPSNLVNRRVVLADRPKGVPEPQCFSLEEAPLGDLGAGTFLVHNKYLSVDPAMRGWVNDAPNYSPPAALGEVMRSYAVGEVVWSRHRDYAEGEVVVGMFGWQRFAVSDGDNVVRKVPETDLPQSLSLGVLGLNGVTAYYGLMDVCAPKAGETVVVSSAAGRGRLLRGPDREDTRLPDRRDCGRPRESRAVPGRIRVRRRDRLQGRSKS